MKLTSIALALSLTAPALAETPMGAAEFEAYTAGRTLSFAAGGAPYGIEEYLPDRRVRWSFLDGECLDGTWYPQGSAICFAYEGREDPVCWEFFAGAGGLSARIAGDPLDARLYEVRGAQAEMLCLGPRIGV